MKKILILFLTFACAFNALAAHQIAGKVWSGVQTYDVAALKKIEASLIGSIVGVRINYRAQRISRRKPNWYESSVWHYAPAEKERFAFVRVMVEKKDLAAFQSLPTDFQSSAEIVLYGKVLFDSDANFLFIHLLGRKATVNPAGNATIDW
ncbi:MAG TPA: hypothetical protein VGI42_06190 [Chthoniobacterales bacterium]